ncbi:hypothetical protein CORC01_05080 [Colletotrichum orchidophilum]|uniref:Uncharacterized protein n=1 Tax=Colletotrichum orchidophilum TaxID=1209926 RepID=A0A1G4BEI8_9PEZI|nr:uncharacterized protein CORC01_05080 [Colletotrichum orchidophilum]OHE99722.1 hypothetical protein CORC01_05080 [Colletotrichum orchidophilum]
MAPKLDTKEGKKEKNNLPPHIHINQAGQWAPHTTTQADEFRVFAFGPNLTALRLQRKLFGATSANDLRGLSV